MISVIELFPSISKNTCIMCQNIHSTFSRKRPRCKTCASGIRFNMPSMVDDDFSLVETLASRGKPILTSSYLLQAQGRSAILVQLQCSLLAPRLDRSLKDFLTGARVKPHRSTKPIASIPERHLLIPWKNHRRFNHAAYRFSFP